MSHRSAQALRAVRALARRADSAPAWPRDRRGHCPWTRTGDCLATGLGVHPISRGGARRKTWLSQPWGWGGQRGEAIVPVRHRVTGRCWPPELHVRRPLRHMLCHGCTTRQGTSTRTAKAAGPVRWPQLTPPSLQAESRMLSPSQSVPAGAGPWGQAPVRAAWAKGSHPKSSSVSRQPGWPSSHSGRRLAWPLERQPQQPTGG